MAFLESIKQELHWDNGISIPLANSRNKILEEEVQKKMKEISSLKSQLTIQKEHISAIMNHLGHLREQLHEEQNLCQAKQQEIESERHLQSLLMNEESRITQEIKRLKKELANMKEKNKLHKNSADKLEIKLEEIKENIHWDQKALDCWLEDAIIKDDDVVLLQTYMQEDAIKIKELELQLEKLNAEEQYKKKLIDKAAINLRLSQMDLDKTAEEFKKAHLERQKCIHQWETAVQQMKKRDDEVEYYISEIITVKHQLQNTKQTLKDKEQNLENVKKLNAQLEKDVAKAERVVSKLQRENTEALAKQREMEKEVTLTQITLNNEKAELSKVQSETVQLDKRLEENRVVVDQERKSLEKLSKELHYRSETVMSTEEYVQQLNNYIAQEQLQAQILQKERIKINEAHSDEARQLQRLNDKSKQKTAELQALKSLLQKYATTTTKLDEELENHKKILLNQDGEISLLTHRLKTMEGTDTHKKQHELQSRLLLIQQVLTAKQSACQALNQEIKQQQDDMRLVQKELQKCTEQKNDLESKLNCVNLHNEIASKQLKETALKNQKLLVDENILKLEIRRLREIIVAKSTNTVSLEKQRLTLETTIKEREQEIDIERESLKTEIRLVEEGRQRLTTELNSCISQTKKLKKRCEIMMMPLKSWKCSDEIEPVHFLIKAAEDKDSLKRETQEMHNKVQKAARELIAFKNTAQKLQEKNERLRKNLTSAGENSVINVEKRKLEEQLQAENSKLETKKKQLASLQKNLMMRQDVFEDVLQEQQRLDCAMKEKQQIMQSLEAKIEEQYSKLSRVDKKLAKLRQELIENSNLTSLIDDVKLRLIREHNKNTVAQIRDWMNKYPETIMTVEVYFKKANLPLPPRNSQTRRYSMASNRSLVSVHSPGNLPSLTSSPVDTPPSSGKRSTSSTVSLPSVVNLTFNKDSPGNTTKSKSPIINNVNCTCDDRDEHPLSS